MSDCIFQSWGYSCTDAEHLYSLDNLSSSSNDLKQLEEDYLCKTKNSRYGVMCERKRWRGKKDMHKEMADDSKSIEEEDQAIKTKEDDELADLNLVM